MDYQRQEAELSLQFQKFMELLAPPAGRLNSYGNFFQTGIAFSTRSQGRALMHNIYLEYLQENKHL